MGENSKAQSLLLLPLLLLFFQSSEEALAVRDREEACGIEILGVGCCGKFVIFPRLGMSLELIRCRMGGNSMKGTTQSLLFQSSEDALAVRERGEAYGMEMLDGGCCGELMNFLWCDFLMFMFVFVFVPNKVTSLNPLIST